MTIQSRTKPRNAIALLAGAIASLAGLLQTRPLKQLPDLQIDVMHTLVAAVHMKLHGALVADRAAALDPAVAARIAQGGAKLAHLLADPLTVLHQGAASILASAGGPLVLALTALLMAGWRGAQLNTLFFHNS